MPARGSANTTGWFVTWAIDIDPDEEDAHDAESAARKALAHILRPGSIAHVFEVTGPDGVTVEVDLDQLDGVPDA